MTREQRVERFFKFHGRTWDYIRRSDAWEDLLDLIRAFDPCRDLPQVTAQSASDNSQHLLGRIAGFNAAVNVLETMERPTQESEPEANFSESTPE